jgi:hypothetical protein
MEDLNTKYHDLYTGNDLHSKYKKLTREKILSSNFYMSINNKHELRSNWNFQDREDHIKKQLGP